MLGNSDYIRKDVNTFFIFHDLLLFMTVRDIIMFGTIIVMAGIGLSSMIVKNIIIIVALEAAAILIGSALMMAHRS